MLGFVSRFLVSFLVGTLVASLSLFFVSLAGLLRLLPRLLQFLRHCLRSLLILCVHLYRFIFSLIAPMIQWFLPIDLMANPWRMIACVLVSLLIGLLVPLVTQMPEMAWIIVPSLLHGLGVGLTWNEIEEPGGLQMGTRIQ